MSLILVINPGGSSTKIALFDGETQVVKRTISHPHEQLSRFEDVLSQRKYRDNAVMEVLRQETVDFAAVDAIVGRGGALKPLESGTYRVNELLIEDIKAGNVQTEHASNLGALIAFDLGQALEKPAFMVDPVSVDEFIPEARISGLPELERKSLDHPLNSKMAARIAAKRLGSAYEEIDVIVAHLGTGISVSAHRKGRMIDVNNPHDGGSFSAQRTGSLPVTQLVSLCYSGKFTEEEMFAKITTRGGLRAYLGTDDMPKVEEMALGGDEKAALLMRAMAYQIAKEIGACAAVLKGEVDAIVFTGGKAHSDYLVNLIKERIAFITPDIFTYPGEHEMESMAMGALRVLRGEEEPRQYK